MVGLATVPTQYTAREKESAPTILLPQVLICKKD